MFAVVPWRGMKTGGRGSKKLTHSAYQLKNKWNESLEEAEPSYRQAGKCCQAADAVKLQQATVSTTEWSTGSERSTDLCKIYENELQGVSRSHLFIDWQLISISVSH